MSSPEINQVLAQMRVMTAQVQGTPAVAEPAGGGFADLLQNSINAVADLQQQSRVAKTAFETGTPGVELADVMIASQKSSIAFTGMVEVRNKLLEAYKDVANMPV